MGYTHYWKHSGFNADEWAAMLDAASAIKRRAASRGVALRGWDGAEPIELTGERIGMNGCGADSFESFILTPTPQDFEFCKTGQRPYDAAVVAMLVVAARINPSFSWRSDGDESDHVDGMTLARGLPRDRTPGAYAAPGQASTD